MVEHIHTHRGTDRKAGSSEGYREMSVARRIGAFPPLEPGRADILLDMALRAISGAPGLAELRKRLIDFGGLEVVLAQHEPHLDELLSRGCDFTTAGLDICVFERSMCHANSAMLWGMSGGEVRIVTGYALSDDGLWRQHSWGLRDGQVIETTEIRVRYYGFELSGGEAEKFASENLSPRAQHVIATSRAILSPISPID